METSVAEFRKTSLMKICYKFIFLINKHNWIRWHFNILLAFIWHFYITWVIFLYLSIKLPTHESKFIGDGVK